MATPPVYSLRIYSGTPSPSGSTVVVPAGLLYVIRDIDAVLESGSGTCVIYAQMGASAVFWYATSDPATQPRWQSWRGRQVAYTGENITFVGASGTWGLNVSGYQLTPP
jgi:hypothetical protein